MRTLIVTSRLTFVPQNYRGFLDKVLSNAGHHVVGLVLIDNLTLRQLAIIPALRLWGAHRLAASLARNAWELRLGKSESLFSDRGLPWAIFPSMNDPRALAWVQELDVDVIVNARTEDIYRAQALAAARWGCVNVHHGLLPDERGMMCELFALAEDRPAGFSLHVMTPRVDDGPILARHEVSFPGEKDLLAFVERSALREGEAVSTLLNETATRGRLPEGQPNRPERRVVRRLTGTPAEVRSFQRRGVLL